MYLQSFPGGKQLSDATLLEARGRSGSRPLRNGNNAVVCGNPQSPDVSREFKGVSGSRLLLMLVETMRLSESGKLE